MADNFYAKYPVSGGSGSGVSSLDSMTGDITLVAGTGISIADGTQTITITNTQAALTLTAVGSTPNANAATLTGQALNLEPASASFPGVVTTDVQSFAGAKTFTGAISASNLSGTNTGDVTLGTANGLSLSSQALSLGLSSTSTTGALSSTDWNTFNSKGSGTVTAVSVASANGFAGSSSGGATPALTISTSISGVLKGNGTAIIAATAGTDYSAGTSALATGILKSTTTTGALTIAIAADFPTLNQNTTGTAANITASSNSTLTTLSSLSLPYSQVTGGPAAITALTGDATASGPGSAALTLATVNTNVGTFGSSTAIPSVTVNGKGLVTAISENAVVAPAGTLTGTTLNSTVVTSSLTSVGTIASGTWSATAIAIAKGGTGQTSKAAAFDALSPMSASGDIIYGGTSGTGTVLVKGSDTNVLTLSGGVPTWAAPSGGAPAYTYTSQSSTLNPAVIGSYYVFSGASFTTTLPTAVGVSGKVIFFEHGGTSLTQVYTLNTTSSQTIGGVASGAYALYTNGEVLGLISDGANWQIAYHYAQTDWSSPVAVTLTAVTTNPTKGTMSNDYVQWRRVGRMCYKRYRMSQSATGSSAAGSGDYLFGLLVTPDTNATTGIPVNTTSATLVNTGAAFTSIIPGSGIAYNVISAATHTFLAPIFFLYSTTAFRVSGRYDTVDANIDSSHIAANGTASGYSFDLYYPANGWQP